MASTTEAARRRSSRRTAASGNSQGFASVMIAAHKVDPDLVAENQAEDQGASGKPKLTSM